ncbi:unnamed protein product [Symbiodinium necroappetens]|uniref:Uncharacterized protein n=1 Tax=Symbiodinium necroappetens TaxID=1628268 RepID=A0A812ZWK9_9DINO|nr:unnamed protein product [Symbiodinium necroappetens]
MSNTSLMSLDRVRALRTRTELLGSVEAVEESFTSATNGMNFLQQIAGSLKTIVNQHVSAAQALKKARQQESETHRKELDRQAKEKKRELEKEAKLQKKLADGKNEPSPAGGCGAGSDAKRRRLFPSAFTEHDPVVLTAQGWSERQVTVVENYAPRLQAAAVSRVLEGENVIIRCRRANVKKAMEALGCKRFSVASVLDLMKLPPVDMKDKLDAFTKLTPEVAAKHDLNVLAGALLPGIWIWCCEPLPLQGPEQSGMIDFLIAHAQEAFAEKAAFVPPPQDGDDGSANELEEPDNPSDFYPKCASSVGQDQDDEDDGGGRDDDRLTSILDEIEEDVEEEAAKKLQAQASKAHTGPNISLLLQG